MKLDVCKFMNGYGISIYDLSDRLGYGINALEHLLHNEAEWSYSGVQKLSKIFNLSVDALQCPSNEKLLFVDYDQTLVGHNYPRDYEESDAAYYDFLCQLTRPDIHTGDVMVPAVVDYMQDEEQKGTKVYVLTHALSNLRDELIAENMRKAIPNATLLTVAAREYKIDMIRAVAYSRNVPLYNCELIDDIRLTLREALSYGVKVQRTVSLCAKWEAMQLEKN